MNLWGATPLLAAVLLGGGHAAKPAASPQPSATASPVSTAQPAVEPQPASIASVTGLSPAGHGKWQATVLLNGSVVLPCPQPSDFSLETSGPAKTFPAGKRPAGRSVPCQYLTLSFSGPAQIPASAVLVLRAPGAPTAATPVSFSRPVSLQRYLLLPAVAGLAMAVLLLVFAVAFVKVYDWDDDSTPIRRLSGSFWRYTVVASGAWTIGDSWATNITPIIGLLATAFGITAAASSLFPGIALTPFQVVNLAAVTVIALVPFAFSILYARWTMKNPGPSADSTIRPTTPLPEAVATGARVLPTGATFKTPVGGVLALPAGGTIGPAEQDFKLIEVTATGEVAEIAVIAERAEALKSGATLPLPPGATADIVPGESMSLPGGPDVIVTGASFLMITTCDGAPLAIPSDQSPAPKSTAGEGPRQRRILMRRGDKHPGGANGAAPDKPPVIALPSPAWVLAPGGAKLTATGAANLWLPAGTRMTAPRRHCPALPTGRHLLIPQGSSTMVANMGLVILAALMTIFGIGVQIGLAAVLIGYSGASPWGRGTLLALIAAAALFTLYYSTTAIRALADPQPGSSLSAVSGTSFTL
jgi:hypothetical protein